MNAAQNTKSGLTLEQHISFIDLSQHERNAALHGAPIGQLLADAVAWVCRKFERPDSSVFAKPSSKYLSPSHEYRQGITRNDIDMYAML